jgi:hypothetical protein
VNPLRWALPLAGVFLPLPLAGADEPGKGTATFVYKKTKQVNLELIVHYPPGWKASDRLSGILAEVGDP